MKEAYYFSHDSNARKDPKVMKLIMKYGMEGYGIYWSVIEMLRESGDYMLSLCDCHAIAYDLHVDANVLESIIKEFSLFEIDKQDKFWSNSLVERMSKFEELRQKRSESGKLGAIKRWNDSNVIAPLKQHQGKAWQSKVKESKVKESKVKESKNKGRFAPPTVKEISDYCIERNNQIDPQHFFDSNETKGWVVGKTQTPMKDWKASVRTWEKNNFNSSEGNKNNGTRHPELYRNEHS